MDIDKMSDSELRTALRFGLATVKNLMKSHDELMEGVGEISVDYGLLNSCRFDGDRFLRAYK